MSRGRLSIVVPCYNEVIRIPRFEESWKAFLASSMSRLQKDFSQIEVIFVNDGSKDETLTALQSLAPRLASSYVSPFVLSLPQNQGKGAAVQKGLQESHGDWILMTDVDLSSPLEEIFKLLQFSEDIVFGSRAVAESDIQVSQGGLRPLLGRAFNLYSRIMSGLPYKDTQCGFKLMRGNLAREIAGELTEKRFAFDIELLMLARQRGATMREVGVVWRHQEPSRVEPLKDGLRMLVKVTELALRRLPWNGVSKGQSPRRS